MITRKKEKILWLLLFILWPLALWTSFQFYFVNIEGQYIDILIFAILICTVALFPITINDYAIFFVNGISIVVFLVFGLFVEIVLIQIALIVVIISTGIGNRELFRLPLNMLSFMFISIISAEVFYVLGGQHGLITYRSLGDIFPILCYALALFMINQFFNKLIDVYFYKRKIKIFDKGFKWEVTTLLLILPVGFVLYLLYSYLGSAGIIFVGIPFIFITVILKLLYSYQEVNDYLKKAGEVGHRLTKRLKINEVHDIFIKEITRLFPIDYAYIYMVLDDENLELVHFHDVQENKVSPFKMVKYDEAFSGKVWSSRQPILYKNAKEWSTLKNSKIPKNTESVLSLPIEYGDSIIGVVTVVSNQKRAFENIHYQILNIITNHLGVATENAKNLENIMEKGEVDGLTKLYNYEYFIRKLNEFSEVVHKIKRQDPFSLLLLDLDHFKRVNDNYGHEAGNEVLCQVAARLKEQIGALDILARYGGEEFILLLPSTDLPQAIQMAENMRETIAGTPFQVNNHLLHTSDTLEISLTTSIGVASYPLHCETLYELIRYADRAMYNGAKNKGRNKVAVYEKI